ncbi:MAG: hypothetical protein IKX60_06465 [Bacteroidales bacterium]|nr:hypothetical protein [Bacteroidales bacterium]
MKKLLLTVAMVMLACGAYAQTEGNGLQSEDVKGFQWGVAFRAEYVNYINGHYATNISAGYRINRGNYVGVQSGFAFKGSTYIDADPGRYEYRGVPLLADYIHYFPLGKAKSHSFYAGSELGFLFAHYYEGFGATVDREKQTFVRNTTPVTRTYPYIGVKTGLDFKLGDCLHLQIGTMMSYFGFGAAAGITF